MGDEFDAINFDKQKINCRVLKAKEMLHQSCVKTGYEINLEQIITKDKSLDIFKDYNSDNLFKKDKNWTEFKFKQYSLNNSIKNVQTLINTGGIHG